MNRTTLVSLAAAAVIGTSGGVALAVNTGGDDAPPAADGQTSGTPSGSPDPGTDPVEDDAALLYYADGAIHDGDTSVAVPTEVASNQVAALQRVQDGWLIVNISEDGETYTGTYLSEKAAPWRIGEWSGPWDISADRERLYVGRGITWKEAVFAKQSTEPLDVLDGPGEELPFMDTSVALNGVALTDTGLITGWDTDGGPRLVETEFDTWTHTSFHRPGLGLPTTSPDGTQAIADEPNPETAPDNPVGDCLTGGPIDDPGSWWEECEIGGGSREPWSPNGDRLLIRGLANDGPGPSYVRVVNPRSGKTLAEWDSGGLLDGVEWAGNQTVYTLSFLNEETSYTVQRCDVDTEKCEKVIKLDGNVVLGSG